MPSINCLRDNSYSLAISVRGQKSGRCGGDGIRTDFPHKVGKGNLQDNVRVRAPQ